MEKSIGDELLTQRRMLQEYSIAGLSRDSNLSSGSGIQQGGIKHTHIGRDSIESPMIKALSILADKLNVTDLADIARKLTIASGHVIIDKDAFGTDLEGIKINDGTRDRVKIGEITSGNYAIDIYDASGVLWCSAGKLQQIWQKVYDSVLSSNATSITISGLDGNNDYVYYIIWAYKATYGGNTYFRVRLNNDGGANYGRQYLYAKDGSPYAGGATDQTDLWLGYTEAANQIGLAYNFLYAKSGEARRAVGEFLSVAAGETIHRHFGISQTWANTSSNITSMVFSATQGSGIKAGSHLIIYKIPKYA